jgi:hypothetical protein
VDARYAVYFDKEDPARRAWSAYRGAVYNYISMRCCDEFIDEDVKNLRAYAAGLASVRPRALGIRGKSFAAVTIVGVRARLSSPRLTSGPDWHFCAGGAQCWISYVSPSPKDLAAGGGLPGRHDPAGERR